MFQDNSLDFAIIRVDLIPHDDLEIIPLLTEEIVFVCSASHRLSACTEVSIQELRNEKFVLMDEKSGIHELCKSVCRNNGI